jgi:DNA-binding Lrp family transcriptional regulator
MRALDETDMEILSLLAENARRPFSEIGESVGLSGPAVSGRVTRLQEVGVINRFTIDIDRTQLRAGVPVLVELDVPPDSVETVRDRVSDAEGVDHVFVTADGEILFHARVEPHDVREWVDGLLDDVERAEHAITILDSVEWTPSIDGVEFALTCAECSNTVDSEGETARIDGEVHHFCCSSCLTRFEERYQRLEEDA